MNDITFTWSTDIMTSSTDIMAWIISNFRLMHNRSITVANDKLLICLEPANSICVSYTISFWTLNPDWKVWKLLLLNPSVLGGGGGFPRKFDPGCHILRGPATHIKMHKLLQVCKQLVANLFTSCRQVVFALLVPSCRNKFETSC